jgi:hypothetical protein
MKTTEDDDTMLSRSEKENSCEYEHDPVGDVGSGQAVCFA